MFLSLIKNEEVKSKSRKSCTKSNLVYNTYFTFYKYHNTNEFIKRFPDSKVNNSKDFKNKLELFYHDTVKLSQIIKSR